VAGGVVSAGGFTAVPAGGAASGAGLALVSGMAAAGGGALVSGAAGAGAEVPGMLAEVLAAAPVLAPAAISMDLRSLGEARR